MNQPEVRPNNSEWSIVPAPFSPARTSFVQRGPVVYQTLASGKVLAPMRDLGGLANANTTLENNRSEKFRKVTGRVRRSLTPGNVALQVIAALVGFNRRHLGLGTSESKAHIGDLVEGARERKG